MKNTPQNSIDRVTVQRTMNGYIITSGKSGSQQLQWVAASDEALHMTLDNIFAAIPYQNGNVVVDNDEDGQL